jgi:hypothetical protein
VRPFNVTLARTAASATIQDNERPRAPINLALPGCFFADMTAAANEANYLHIANPYAGISLPVCLTFTRPDGSHSTVRRNVIHRTAALPCALVVCGSAAAVQRRGCYRRYERRPIRSWQVSAS